MSTGDIDILTKNSILESITRTLLYEGYSLFPYHRSAIKNQKPIPFGVVYPNDYNIFNTHAHSNMQTECIVTGDENLIINISVRFLRLKKIQILQKEVNESKEDNLVHPKFSLAGGDTSQDNQLWPVSSPATASVNESKEDNFIPVYELNLNGELFQPGWQTIELKLDSGDLSVSQLMEKSETISFEFDSNVENISLCDENGEIAAKQINSILGMKGTIIIKASAIENNGSAFMIHVTITNDTPVSHAKEVSRDEIFNQSFLSTNTILNAVNGKFISVQNPDENWRPFIEQCHNIRTWPILIDESDTTLLSSPIIVYDYPKINPKSHGDLFDSLEIEEALMLHFSVMSDDEKQRIAQSDDKLRSMLTKVGQVTPEEIINLHGGFSNNQPTIHSKKE